MGGGPPPPPPGPHFSDDPVIDSEDEPIFPARTPKHVPGLHDDPMDPRSPLPEGAIDATHPNFTADMPDAGTMFQSAQITPADWLRGTADSAFGTMTQKIYDELPYRMQWLDRNTNWDTYELPPQGYPDGDFMSYNYSRNETSWANLGRAARAVHGGAATNVPNPDLYRTPHQFEQIREPDHFALFWSRFANSPVILGYENVEEFFFSLHRRRWQKTAADGTSENVTADSQYIDDFIEHPELIAERTVRYASVVGKENMMVGSDCGFGTSAWGRRVEARVAWAKLESMVEGARLASQELW